jgi:cytochrome c oxidase cbb3-type subunit 2
VVIGACHALAAIVAGRLLDRGLFRSLLLGTFVAFALAFALLERGVGWGTSPLYAAGISTYSVALVTFPSWRGSGPGLVPPRWRAALVYGVAGWIGSALGVGLSEGVDRVPVELVATAGVVLIAGLALERLARTFGRLRAHRISLFIAAGAIALYSGPWTRGGARLGATSPSAAATGYWESDPAIARGREVYVAEGCIHCHSQFVRRHTDDVLWWGPSSSRADRDSTLIGNRRQGPDLSNVGLRRSELWQRLHLQDPRAVSPGSIMPSYAHLFSNGSTRGDDLVAYLDSLGAGHEPERLEAIRSYEPSTAILDAGDAGRGAERFARTCTPCHGRSGRGDGPAAAGSLDADMMDLRKEELWLPGKLADDERAGLARLIKFGWPGGSMPGHEYFDDVEIADLVAYVRALREDRTR